MYLEETRPRSVTPKRWGLLCDCKKLKFASRFIGPSSVVISAGRVVVEGECCCCCSVRPCPPPWSRTCGGGSSWNRCCLWECLRVFSSLVGDLSRRRIRSSSLLLVSFTLSVLLLFKAEGRCAALREAEWVTMRMRVGVFYLGGFLSFSLSFVTVVDVVVVVVFVEASLALARCSSVRSCRIFWRLLINCETGEAKTLTYLLFLQLAFSIF